MALHRLLAFFLFTAAAAAVTPEECADEGLCPTPGCPASDGQEDRQRR
eukprot:CAMPEP_0183384538 /NCGR_PEP_ID=MMETSP0370-20130417/649_1 /TAXON_ID=268820 /ORGANISM="Peridinium aciculiferum, Strain PAER-2" /LENGTH=47 /DNA_ID= /DNA_START= /DNA_END= /DNA_ORIENTATION=